MGSRKYPLKFICKSCGKEAETRNTGNKGIFCCRQCKSNFERKGRAHPCKYEQNGYWMLRWNENGKYKYKFEHRKIWEDQNCEVPKGYIIHHINGIKKDNRLENLRLMRRTDHTALHKKGNKNDKETE